MNAARVTVVLLSLFIFSSSLAGASTDLPIAPQSGQVTFEAIGNPSALRIKGSTSSLAGKFVAESTGITGKIEVALETLDTGIKMRNEHMTKRYLETEKYPKGELSITRVGDLKSGSALTAGTMPFEGQFTLHGVTRPVTGQVVLSSPSQASIPFEANFEISLKDFQIRTPSFAGITIADQVKVNVKGAATKPSGQATL